MPVATQRRLSRKEVAMLGASKKSAETARRDESTADDSIATAARGRRRRLVLGGCAAALLLACSHSSSTQAPQAPSSMDAASSGATNTAPATTSTDDAAKNTTTSGGADTTATAQGATPSDKPKPVVDPAALSELARSTAYVHSLDTMKVRAETTRDALVGDKYKLQKTEEVELAIRRPDRMRAEIIGDDRHQIIVDDGKTLTIFSKPEKYYATMSALPTVHETLDVATAQFGVEAPLVDIIQMAGSQDLAKNVTAARAIGPSRVDGVLCEHLAFRTNDLDWQVWIEKGDRPLPKKIVVTTRGATAAPQYTARLTWDAAPVVPDSLFTFIPPEGATQMALARVIGSKGQAPPEKQKKAKTAPPAKK